MPKPGLPLISRFSPSGNRTTNLDWHREISILQLITTTTNTKYIWLSYPNILGNCAMFLRKVPTFSNAMKKQTMVSVNRSIYLFMVLCKVHLCILMISTKYYHKIHKTRNLNLVKAQTE
jgi:hypothetical protein